MNVLSIMNLHIHYKQTSNIKQKVTLLIFVDFLTEVFVKFL